MIKSMKYLAVLFPLLILPATAVAQTRILIVGASITWGCVSDCSAVQTEQGYLERLRALLPTYDIRALTWFGAGIADWDPASPTISEQSLNSPAVIHGVGEYDIRARTNLWDLFAGPHVATWNPDYVLFALGAGDILRVLRNPPLAATASADYGDAMRRISDAVISQLSTPVYVFDTPFDQSLAPFVDELFAGYEAELLEHCDGNVVRCIPDVFDAIDRVDHFVGTDGVHFNAGGHEAYAQALADWFLNDSRPILPSDLPGPPPLP